MPENSKKYLIWLIIISTAVRAFIAGFIELGNDEVYYWTYALYPGWSHFDHPPMVGFVIQLFSLDLLLKDEFFIRLGSIIFGAVNTWLIYLIGAKIKDNLTGFYAALLYTTSIYCFIIAGIFILPDTPQVLFWLISLYLIVYALPDTGISPKSRQKIRANCFPAWSQPNISTEISSPYLARLIQPNRICPMPRIRTIIIKKMAALAQLGIKMNFFNDNESLRSAAAMSIRPM